MSDCLGIVFSETPYAVISGFPGQDANHLAEYLLRNGYQVLGLVAPSLEPITNALRIQVLKSHHNGGTLKLAFWDVRDQQGLADILNRYDVDWLDEFYHLAAKTKVTDGETNPSETWEVNVGGTRNVLMTLADLNPGVRILHAGSSQMFGMSAEQGQMQDEATLFSPPTAYGETKVAAHDLVVEYRERVGLYACTAILFYHKSYLSSGFVWDKVIGGLLALREGMMGHPIMLGNLDAEIDFGWPPDYAEAMHIMLHQPKPQDLVVATGETHTVTELVERVARAIYGEQIPFHRQGNGLYLADRLVAVGSSPREIREYPEPRHCGDATKLRALGWKPTLAFAEMVQQSVANWPLPVTV